MNRLVSILAAATVAAGAACITTWPAHAAPDPHMPDPLRDYCPGGGAGNVLMGGYCDGEHYPDGSYWHKLMAGGAYSLPIMVPGQSEPADLGMSCVIDPDNGPVPQPAPPGGCGGAVK
ncbi:hypothetical protein [Mycobacterium helveticum]|jgi:hypothetical protein|uniref:Lipoprotein n=1 Tax=Mycobacterium helveticum TaxID=2592811 RepID=A0A557XTM4_9MYCO|nr:hypothetical protein [Mycobacterium helveticum]TVS85214.1 hypothetical protein FPZ46_15315 [Mycobacterium helveticum]TVS89318.1 hypothetical protein FPZ47_12070 [Mycobacterium helveticum]